MPARQSADPLTFLIRQPTGDEPFDVLEGSDDAQRRILGANQRTDTIDDQLQDLVDGLNRGDAADGAVQGLELLALDARQVSRRDGVERELERSREGVGRLALAVDPDSGPAIRRALQLELARLMPSSVVSCSPSPERDPAPTCSAGSDDATTAT